MGRIQKTGGREVKQRKMWLDYYQTEEGHIIPGIECDDPALTFDGHYICVFPIGKNEEDNTKATERAMEVLAYMQGRKQIKRY